nr:unnamed protein product [Digitaria exilis]
MTVVKGGRLDGDCESPVILRLRLASAEVAG